MKRQDKLEQFIRDHREDFDSLEPGRQVWDALEAKIGAGKTSAIVKPLRRQWLKAAVAVLVAGGGLLFLLSRQHGVSAGHPGAITPQLAEMQHYYTRKIERKIAYIRSLPGGKESLPPETAEGLQNDNAAYRQLKEALLENPGDQRVQAAFVQYYRSRLEVLDRITNTIHNIQEEKENDHEKAISI